jgi:toxin CcdB
MPPEPATTLNPVIEIDGTAAVMVTRFSAAVPVQMLKTPVARAEERRGDITAALDLLFQGF